MKDDCGVNESSFTSAECLSCERGFCKFEAQEKPEDLKRKRIQNRIRIIKKNPKVAELMREWAIKKMTDTDLAELDECPFCMTTFDLAWTEVDADNFCRVTCAGCEEYLEYNLNKVDVPKSEITGLRDQVVDLMTVIGHLYEMRDIIRDRIIDLEREIDFIGGMNYQNPFLKGEVKAYSECLSLLGSTNFRDHEKGEVSK